MDLVLFIWNFFRDRLPGGNRPARVLVWRQSLQFAYGQPPVTTADNRTFVGWMQRAPEHSLCARPPCDAFGRVRPANGYAPPGDGQNFRWY